MQSIALLIPDSVVPEFTHTGLEISVPGKTSQYVLYGLVFGYTGFRTYRTQILSPSQSGTKAIDCKFLYNTKKSSGVFEEHYFCLVGRFRFVQKFLQIEQLAEDLHEAEIMSRYTVNL